MKLPFTDILRAIEGGREIRGSKNLDPDQLIDLTRIFLACEEAAKLLTTLQEDIFKAHGGKASNGRFSFDTPEQTRAASEAANAVLSRKVRLDADLPKLTAKHMPENASPEARLALRPFLSDDYAKTFDVAPPSLVDEDEEDVQNTGPSARAQKGKQR